MKTRKNLTKKALAGAAIVSLTAMPGMIDPAAAAVGTLNINASVVQAVAITGTEDLNFGQVAAGTLASTVVVAATAAAVAAGANVIGGGQNGLIGIDAASGFNVNVTIDAAGSVTCDLGTGTCTPLDKMSVTGIALDAANNTDVADTAIVVAIPGASHTDVFVGGTLNVGANQASGTYAGTVNITANY